MRTRLFQCTTRRLSLTEAGETFYRTCTTVVSDLQEVEIALTSTQTEPQGKARIDWPAASE
ncbi:Regulatory protein [Pseudomonas syringae pv. syringae]|nr:Regulatory protein [Pseudomonas syringae pv. syringae]